MTISQIEDRLIDVVKGLNIFKLVDSLGRKSKPVALNYPSAFVYFLSDRNTESQPRPVYELIYEVVVVNKNVSTEAKAAKDTYSYIDSVRDAINGKTLGISDIEPFTCVSRDMTAYEEGVIMYTLRFKTRHYLPVPIE